MLLSSSSVISAMYGSSPADAQSQFHAHSIRFFIWRGDPRQLFTLPTNFSTGMHPSFSITTMPVFVSTENLAELPLSPTHTFSFIISSCCLLFSSPSIGGQNRNQQDFFRSLGRPGCLFRVFLLGFGTKFEQFCAVLRAGKLNGCVGPRCVATHSTIWRCREPVELPTSPPPLGRETPPRKKNDIRR